MKAVYYLAAGKLLRLLREPWAFLLMIILPLSFTYFMGHINTEGNKQIPISIADLDRSPFSTELIDALKDNPMYRVSVSSKEKAISEVRAYRAMSAFIIPGGFSERIAGRGAPGIEVYSVGESGELAAAQNVFRSTINKVVSAEIIAGFVLKEISLEKDISGRQELIRERVYQNARFQWFPAPPVDVEVIEFSGSVAGYNQMTHASIGFALFFSMYTVIFGVGEILTEKNNGTWHRLMVFPPARWQILGGNILGTFIVGFIQLIILVLAGKYLFGVSWGHNIIQTLIILAAFVFCVTCIGLLLSGILKTGKQLQAVTPILVVSTSMLGGCFWPLDIVHSRALLALSKFIPQTWAVSPLESIVLKGQAPAAVLGPAGILMGMGVLFFAVGLITFRWEDKKL